MVVVRGVSTNSSVHNGKNLNSGTPGPPARVAEKVSNFCPKTWILTRETEKSGSRECRKKCRIFDQKHGFKVQNGKIGSARAAEKVTRF